MFAYNSFIVRFWHRGNGYFVVESKLGRYLDMREEPNNVSIFNAWSISRERFENNLWAMDSFEVKLIYDQDGYFMIKSKHGRYLDMREESNYEGVHIAWSISEEHLKKNLWAKNSFLVRFIPQN